MNPLHKLSTQLNYAGGRLIVNGEALNYFRWMGKTVDTPMPGDDADGPGIEPQEMLAEFACTNTSLRRAARRLGQLYD
jgi:hypothetical protein